jgi:hypothetical protein
MENLSITTVDRICTPEFVWYAAYGSNLLRSRFLCYIKGTAPTENHRAHAGCRDSSDPVGHAIAQCEYPVVYAGERSSWGEGGVAFLDIDGDGSTTPLRLWRVTREQFEDVCAMENGLLPGAVTIDFGALCKRGTMDVSGSGWYGLGVYLGDFEGDPVVTFTWRERRTDLNGPSERYAGVIRDGLLDMKG